MASILEYEANRAEDYPKVARVLYNRLDQDMLLQLDSTVSYISKRKGDVFTTAAERASPSAYNTYKQKGLPPGPIGSPVRGAGGAVPRSAASGAVPCPERPWALRPAASAGAPPVVPLASSSVKSAR